MEELKLTFNTGDVLTSDHMNTIVSAINRLIGQVNDNTEAIQDFLPSGESEELN